MRCTAPVEDYVSAFDVAKARDKVRDAVAMLRLEREQHATLINWNVPTVHVQHAVAAKLWQLLGEMRNTERWVNSVWCDYVLMRRAMIEEP